MAAPKTMEFRVIHGLYIVVHTAAPPTDEEWAEYIASYRGVNSLLVRTIVFTEGGGPDTKKRALVDQMLQGRPSPLAVVSESVWVRTIAKALSWTNPFTRVFSPAAVEEAYRYLHLTPAEQELVEREVRSMRRRLSD